MQLNRLLKTAFLFLFGTITINVFAQGDTSVKAVEPSSNMLEILMVIVAIIFCFVIWGMTSVLSSLGRQLIEKNKVANPPKALMTAGLLCMALMGQAQDTTAKEGVESVMNYGGMDSTGFWVMVMVITTEVLVIVVMMILMKRLLAELIPQKIAVVKTAALKDWWARLDKKLFTKAVPVEKEQDILLDHDYDGIRELDNALPPWWKYGFILTIFVAFFYLLNFHVFAFGKNPTQEYETEMADAAIQKEMYEAKNADKIDENNLKMPNVNGIAAAKEIFSSVCWACHGKLGEGGAGPNLTDEYWLHKGSLADVYESIKHGYPDKGMQAWEKNYSPKEISNLAGYILTLKGTNPPNSKAAQGDLFESSADSSIVQTASK